MVCRLNWLPISFSLHVKYIISFHIVSFPICLTLMYLTSYLPRQQDLVEKHIFFIPLSFVVPVRKGWVAVGLLPNLLVWKN